MKIQIALVLLVFSIISVFGVVVDVPRVDNIPYLDGEKTKSVSYVSDVESRSRTFLVQMTFNATMTNNVQIAFGVDQTVPANISVDNPDGLDCKLAAEETSMIIGWNCGKWFLRPEGLKTKYEFPVTNFTSGSRTLKFEVNISKNGKIREFICKDNGQTFSFDDFNLEENANWLKPDDWSMLRVTTRGWDVAEEDVKVKFTNDRTLILIQ